MKIAHVSPEFFPAIGGVGQVVRELAQRQVKKGHGVHVYAPDWDKEKRIEKKEDEIDGIKIHRCRYLAQMANFSTFWPSLFTKLMREDFDVIHSHLFAHPHFVIAALVAKLKGIPHIHTTHCPWSDAPRSLIGKLGILVSYNLFSRIALRGVKNILTITPWENKFLIKLGVSENKLINIPNGMSKEFFVKVKNNDFKKKYGINGQMVLFFGRLNFTKGPEKFVEIAKLILKTHPSIYFVMVGPDEGMKKKVIEKIGEEKRIILLPAIRDRKETIKMYQSAEVYVMPSYREGLPLTLFEAMASGLPIVATPVNGIPYEITDNKNGYLVKYGDNEKFKEKIIKILSDKKLKEKLAKENLKKSRKYNWDKIEKRTTLLYKNERKR
jgi:glycosyltransferase involved in cell wall biosynthesis